MADRRVELETAVEREILEDSLKLIRHLRECAMHNPLCSAVFDLQRAHGLSGHHTLALLAYHALVAAEKSKQAHLDYINRNPCAPFFITKGDH